MALTEFTTIKVDREVREKLLALKYKYNFKSVNELLKYILSSFDSGSGANLKAPTIESKARELIFKACLDLGEEAKYFPMLVVKRYKISDPALVEYFKSISDKEIVCSQVLSPTS